MLFNILNLNNEEAFSSRNTYKNLVYDLAHHESPIAQWLERPTGIWKVMGSTPVGGSENSFSEYFNLRMLLHYLHFIQVTNPFITFIHIYHFDTLSLAVWQDTCHTYKNLVYDLAHHESPIQFVAQWLEHPTSIWKVMGLDSRWGTQKILFPSTCIST